MTPGNGGTLNENDAVIYIDSKSGGFTDTSTFGHTGDSARTATSGYQTGANNVNSGNSSRTVASFAPGFAADYALSIQDGYVNLFDLSTINKGYFSYVTGTQQNGAPLSLTVTAAQIGLPTYTSSFNFVGTLISSTAYRSNETIGASTTTPANGDPANASFTGTTTFSNFDTFTPAPEPSGLVPLLMGELAIAGLIVKRRRAASSAAA